MPVAQPDAGPLTERLPGPPDPVSPSELASAAGAYEEFRRRDPTGDVDAWTRSLPDGPAGLFRELHQKDPASALQLAAAAGRMPSAGQEFAGFRLVRELGRGAFGRVFLAEQ